MANNLVSDTLVSDTFVDEAMIMSHHKEAADADAARTRAVEEISVHRNQV